jgi:hypothetical protein
MARTAKIDRPRPTEIQLPASIRAKIDSELYSEIEGRVPHGALSELFVGLAADWLKARGVVV